MFTLYYGNIVLSDCIPSYITFEKLETKSFLDKDYEDN